jgi:hypothetical protein
MELVARSIQIRTISSTGREPVAAEVRDPLAIHPIASTAAYAAWTITHVPSGRMLFHGRDREHALELLAQCFDAFPADRWAHCEGDPEIAAFVQGKRSRARRHQEA